MVGNGISEPSTVWNRYQQACSGFKADSLEIRMTAMQQPGSQIGQHLSSELFFFETQADLSLKVSSCPSQVQ